MQASKENALIISYEACKCDLLTEMVNYIGMLEFESRKDLVAIFGAVIRIDNNGQKPGLEYVLRNQNILTALFDGWVVGWRRGRGRGRQVEPPQRAFWWVGWAAQPEHAHRALRRVGWGGVAGWCAWGRRCWATRTAALHHMRSVGWSVVQQGAQDWRLQPRRTGVTCCWAVRAYYVWG